MIDKEKLEKYMEGNQAAAAVGDMKFSKFLMYAEDKEKKSHVIGNNVTGLDAIFAITYLVDSMMKRFSCSAIIVAALAVTLQSLAESAAEASMAACPADLREDLERRMMKARHVDE